MDYSSAPGISPRKTAGMLLGKMGQDSDFPEFTSSTSMTRANKLAWFSLSTLSILVGFRVREIQPAVGLELWFEDERLK